VSWFLEMWQVENLLLKVYCMKELRWLHQASVGEDILHYDDEGQKDEDGDNGV